MRTTPPALIASLFLLPLLSVPATTSAGVITDLFSTGVDMNSQPLANGAVDPHYSIVANPQDGSTPSTALVQTTGYPIGIAYVNAAPGSEWIEPSAFFPGTNAPPGFYDYQTTFTLPSAAGAVKISFNYAADDFLAGVLLNGTLVAAPPINPNQGDFNSLHPLTFISQSILTGTNTLTLVVQNGPNVGPQNPTALTVSGINAVYGTDVPEPGTIGLLAVSAIGLLIRRRTAL